MTGNGFHTRYAPIATGIGDENSMVVSESRQRTTTKPANSPARRRAFSWRGESPPYERPKNESILDPRLVPMIKQEARCVSVWLVLSGFIQVVVSILIRVASYAYPHKSWPPGTAAEPFATWWVEWIVVLPSVVSGCLLRFVPTQVVSNTAPGFIYASAWYVHDFPVIDLVIIPGQF